jgi:hypothetical protein
VTIATLPCRKLDRVFPARGLVLALAVMDGSCWMAAG